MQKVKYYIFTVELFCSQIFSALMGVLGREFSGSEGDSSYIFFCMFFTSLSIFIIIHDFIREQIKFTKIELLLLSSPFFIIYLFILEQPIEEQATNMFMQYLLWCVPAITIGIYIGKKNSIKDLVIPLTVCAILLILGLSKAWLGNLGGFLVRRSTSGESYQAASYSAAISFSILLFLFLFKKLIPPIVAKYRLFFLPLMFLCLIIIFLTGGRGGMVLVIVTTFVFLILYQKKNNIAFKTKVKIILSLLISIFILITYIHSNPILNETSQRVFSYISTEGVDMSQTSHRDEAYSKALKNINHSPVVGYGFFKYFDTNKNYPHNIILEFLLQGGVIYLFLILLFSILYFRKLNIMIHHSLQNSIILIFLLYTLVKVMFSGSYISTGTFWFSISYVISYHLNINTNNLQINYEKNITHS